MSSKRTPSTSAVRHQSTTRPPSGSVSKVRTAAHRRKPARTAVVITPRARVVGLDVHKKDTEVCVLDASSQEPIARGRIATSAHELRRRFGGCQRLRIVLEASTLSPWVSRLLVELGHDVVVASPRHVRLVAEGRHKSDRVDAEILARLLRADPKLLHPVTHRGVEAQVTRGILKMRDQLVRARGRLSTCVRGILASNGIAVPASEPEQLPHTVENSVDLPKGLAPAILAMLAQIAASSETIRHFDKQIAEIAKSDEVELLMTMPGVGPVVAAAFVSTIDDPTRFEDSHSVGAWLGLTPSRHQSGDRDVHGRITKEGDPLMRRLLIQAAHAHRLSAQDTALRRWTARIEEKGERPMKAVVALARKMAVVLHRMWVTNTPYQPNPAGCST